MGGTKATAARCLWCAVALHARQPAHGDGMDQVPAEASGRLKAGQEHVASSLSCSFAGLLHTALCPRLHVVLDLRHAAALGQAAQRLRMGQQHAEQGVQVSLACLGAAQPCGSFAWCTAMTVRLALSCLWRSAGLMAQLAHLAPLHARVWCSAAGSKGGEFDQVDRETACEQSSCKRTRQGLSPSRARRCTRCT